MRTLRLSNANSSDGIRSIRESNISFKCVYGLCFIISNDIRRYAVPLHYNLIQTNGLVYLCIVMDQTLCPRQLPEICVQNMHIEHSIRSKTQILLMNQVFLFILMACSLMYENYYTFSAGCLCCSISSLGLFIDAECDRRELELISCISLVPPLTGTIATVFSGKLFFSSSLLCFASTLR